MRKLYKTACIILFLVSSVSVSGQQKNLIDSLTRELKKQIPDTSRIKLLLELTNQYYLSDSKKAFEYINKAKAIAEKINSPNYRARVYYYEGKIYFAIADCKSALKSYEKALPLFKKAKKLSLVAVIYFELGMVYSETFDYQKALEYTNYSLDISKKLKDNEGLSRCFFSMGIIYSLQNNFKTSNEYLQKAISLNTNKLDIAVMYSNISLNYYLEGNYNKSLSYFDSIVPVYKEMNNYHALSNVYKSFGNTYRALKNYKKASEYFNISLKYGAQSGNQGELISTQSSLARLYIEMNLPDSAIILLKKCIELNKKLNIGDIHEKLYYDISKAYEKKGDIKSAFEYFKQYKEVSDSSAKQLSDEKLLDIQTKWEVDKKNEQIKLLAKDKQLARQQTLTYGLIFMIILISGVSFYIYKQHRNREKRLKLEAELKDAAYQIDLKNRELTHKAMTLSQQEQILSGIKEQLLNVEIESTRAKEAVLGVISNIDIQLNQNTMEDFEKYFIEIHPEFFNRLKQKYPELTPAEHKVCALLRLSLNTKEIASLTHKTTRSVETIRTTIRKKMGLDKENLYEVIASV